MNLMTISYVPADSSSADNTGSAIVVLIPDINECRDIISC